jgi:hypothetical protein
MRWSLNIGSKFRLFRSLQYTVYIAVEYSEHDKEIIARLKEWDVPVIQSSQHKQSASKFLAKTFKGRDALTWRTVVDRAVSFNDMGSAQQAYSEYSDVLRDMQKTLQRWTDEQSAASPEAVPPSTSLRATEKIH